MTPRPVSCIACGEVFPANHELMTVPQASCIAFDRARMRVWRICAACGSWNLLGVDATTVAMPELVARFAAAVKHAGSDGFAPAHLGKSLELVTVGAVGPVDATAAAIERRWQKMRAAIRWSLPLLLAGGLAVIATLSWRSRKGGMANDLPQLIAVWAMGYLAYAKVRKRYGVQYHAAGVVIAIALVLVAFGVDLAFLRVGDALALLIMAVLLGVLAKFVRPLTLLKASLSDGTTVRLYSLHDIDQVSISWSANGAVTVRGFPTGQEFNGADATNVLRSWFNARNNHLRQSSSAAGYDLLRAAGGLRGVLQALEGVRDDQASWVVLADLPPVYRFALDFALTDVNEGPTAQPSLTSTHARAAVVADEAEALDRELDGRRPQSSE